MRALLAPDQQATFDQRTAKWDAKEKNADLK
jgi:hypothetical protein